MNRFREGVGVIPGVAKTIALVAGGGLLALTGWLVQMPPSKGEEPLPLAAKICIPIVAAVFVATWILLDGFVYGDAKRRGMRYVMWTWLAVLVPDGIGIILYFILRDPMPAACPRCGEMVPAKYSFCPKCGAASRPTCPQCGKAVEGGWTNCAYCGTKLPVQKLTTT